MSRIAYLSAQLTLVLEGQNGGGNKDCACLQYIENGPPNFEFTVQEVLEQQKFITDLINLKDDPNERGGTYMVSLRAREAENVVMRF